MIYIIKQEGFSIKTRSTQASFSLVTVQWTVEPKTKEG